MKIKTNELTPNQLDWLVATIHGYRLTTDGIQKLLEKGKELLILGPHNSHLHYSPTTDWAQGGPIIERELITVIAHFDFPDWTAWTPAPECEDGEAHGIGPTPLIAAMRCYVASKLGDEVEVPEELK